MKIWELLWLEDQRMSGFSSYVLNPNIDNLALFNNTEFQQNSNDATLL